jgi:hypothetical protein
MKIISIICVAIVLITVSSLQSAAPVMAGLPLLDDACSDEATMPGFVSYFERMSLVPEPERTAHTLDILFENMKLFFIVQCIVAEITSLLNTHNCACEAALKTDLALFMTVVCTANEVYKIEPFASPRHMLFALYYFEKIVKTLGFFTEIADAKVLSCFIGTFLLAAKCDEDRSVWNCDIVPVLRIIPFNNKILKANESWLDMLNKMEIEILQRLVWDASIRLDELHGLFVKVFVIK